MHRQIILLHQDAPTKPPLGTPCNGCGVCCAAEPCPAGMLIFRQRRGACPALHWEAPAHRYQCGLLARPEAHLRWLPHFAVPLARRLFRRWIGAGIGCDSTAEAA